MIVLPSVSSGVISSSLSKTFDPKKISGLALWLKADAGVSKFSFNYVSRIILSGGYGTGTYDASTVPNWDFENGQIEAYSLGDIYYYNNIFTLSVGGVTNGSIISYDGINWEVEVQYYIPPTISGVTGDFAGANSSSYEYNDSPQIIDYFLDGSFSFYIQGDFNNYSLSAYNSGDYYPNIATCVNGVWTGNIPETANISGFVTKFPDPNNMPTGSITTENTDNVTGWADQSGNGRNAASYGDPQLITNQINGKPAIDFDATQYFSSDNQNLNNNSSLFFVVKSRGDHGVLLSTSDYQGLVLVLTANPNNSLSIGISNLVEMANDSTNNGNNWMIASTIRSNNLTSIIYKNGTQVATGNYDTSELYPEDALIIGADADFNEYWNLDGQIAEIIIYNRAITTTERQQVEAYLNAKYAIY